MNGKEIKGGYIFKSARINLTYLTVREQEIPNEVLFQFVGGTGIGIKYLYKEVPPEIDPFDSRNLLIFSTGPLTGTGVPGSGTYAVITKSPLTGFAASAQANGFFGARLKFSGFDNIIVEGASERPVYLLIKDSQIEIKDAEDMVGLDTIETQIYLKKKYSSLGENNLSVACIGPAGENQVRYAGVFSDEGHVAASGGAGGVMGSKKLKAIVVCATKAKGQIPIYKPEEFKKLVKEWREEALSSPTPKSVSKYGTAGWFVSNYERGELPIKNLTTNIFQNYMEFDGGKLRNLFQLKPRPCFACPIKHCHIIKINNGDLTGFEGEEPEYECLAAWGPNVGVTDPLMATKITNVVDRLGLDAKEASFTISLLMECYEKGLIREVDGIRPDWGDGPAVISLLKKIALREGFGNILAEGVVRTAKYIGGDALNFAVYVKKSFAPHMHDCRTRWGTLFGQAISNMGSQDGIDLTHKMAPDLGFLENLGNPDDLVAKAQAITGAKRQFEDTLIFCYFFRVHIKKMVETLNAVTGFGLSPNEGLEVGRRVNVLLRSYNILCGHTVDDDSMSPRLLEPPSNGPGKGKSLAPMFDRLRQVYYREMGFDENTGKPLPLTLSALGLEEVAKDLW